MNLLFVHGLDIQCIKKIKQAVHYEQSLNVQYFSCDILQIGYQIQPAALARLIKQLTAASLRDR